MQTGRPHIMAVLPEKGYIVEVFILIVKRQMWLIYCITFKLKDTFNGVANKNFVDFV